MGIWTLIFANDVTAKGRPGGFGWRVICINTLVQMPIPVTAPKKFLTPGSVWSI
jgi:hypothetical protein